MNRIHEKKNQQYENNQIIKYFFHHVHIYEIQEVAYEQINESGAKRGIPVF